LTSQADSPSEFLLGNLGREGALYPSLLDLHLTLPAKALSAAGSLDIHARFHRRLQEILSDGNLNLPIMRLKTNEHLTWQESYYSF
jgi:hypothetical protein